jgi:hypothetical protein
MPAISGRDRVDANPVLASFQGELARHPDDCRLVRRVGQRREQLEAQRAVQGGHVHDGAVAGLQVRPCSAGEVEHQVDLVLLRGTPLLVGEVLEPAEVGSGGEVEQHVDSAVLAHRQLDELRAFGGITETTRLQRQHLATRGPHDLKGLCGRLDRHVATDEQRALPSERLGSGAPHASACARDDAHLFGEPP